MLVCSTGVIGHLMPMDKIEAGIPKLVEKLHADASEEFGRAILTTDLALKSHAVEIQTEKGVVTIGGACQLLLWRQSLSRRSGYRHPAAEGGSPA